MRIPTKLKGFPVIAIAYRGTGSYHVMMHRKGASDPYVFATWMGGKDWHWGHYHETLPQALSASADISWLDRKTLQPLKG